MKEFLLHPSFPRLDFEAFDAFEFPGVAGNERRFEAAGLGGDEKVERAERGAGGFKCCPDVGVMQSGFQSEVGDPEKRQEGFESPGLLRMRAEVLLYSSPEFRRDDDRDAGECRVGQLVETGSATQDGDARAGIEHE